MSNENKQQDLMVGAGVGLGGYGLNKIRSSFGEEKTAEYIHVPDMRDWEVNDPRYKSKKKILTETEEIAEARKNLEKYAYDEMEELKKLREQSLADFRKNTERLDKLNPTPNKNYEQEMKSKIEQRNPSKEKVVTPKETPKADPQKAKVIPGKPNLKSTGKANSHLVRDNVYSYKKHIPLKKKVNKGKIGLLAGGITATGIGGKVMYDKMHQGKTAFIEDRMMLEKTANPLQRYWQNVSGSRYKKALGELSEMDYKPTFNKMQKEKSDELKELQAKSKEMADNVYSYKQYLGKELKAKNPDMSSEEIRKTVNAEGDVLFNNPEFVSINNRINRMNSNEFKSRLDDLVVKKNEVGLHAKLSDEVKNAKKDMNVSRIGTGVGVGVVAAGGKKIYENMNQEKTAFIEGRMLLEKYAAESEDPVEGLAYLGGMGLGGAGYGAHLMHKDLKEKAIKHRQTIQPGLHPDALEALQRGNFQGEVKAVMDKPSKALLTQLAKKPFSAGAAVLGGGAVASTAYKLSPYSDYSKKKQLMFGEE